MAVFAHFLILIRSVFPRWNFFDHIGYQFHLKYRTSESASWTFVDFQSKRTWKDLFFNPNHNLTLAQVSLIEHFAQDVQTHEHKQVPSLDSFRMVRALIELEILSDSTSSFQFALEASQNTSQVELYFSPWLKEEKES